jgi:hypothetical protein
MRYLPPLLSPGRRLAVGLQPPPSLTNARRASRTPAEPHERPPSLTNPTGPHEPPLAGFGPAFKTAEPPRTSPGGFFVSLLPFGCKGWHSFDQVRRPYRVFSYWVLSHRADFHLPGASTSSTGPPRGWHGLQGRGHRTYNRIAAAWCCPETVGSRSFSLPCLHLGLGLFPDWPAWSSRPNRAVRFVKIPAQPSWSLPLIRSCGLSAPARSHEPCSLGFHRVCLSAGIPAAVLSRYASAPSDSRCQPAVAFRSRGFSPPQRFAPAAASRACCIPLPT